MDGDARADRSGGTHRGVTVLAFLALTVLAGFALPSAAWLVERLSGGAENWIFPVQLVFVGLVAVGYQLWRPGRRRTGRGTPTRLIWGLAATLGAVLLADAVWLFAIAG